MIWETILAKLKTLKALLETILSSQVTYTNEPIFGKLNTDGTFFCETHLLLYKDSFSRLDFFVHKMPRLFGRLCQEMLVVLIFKSISRRWRWPLSIELNCCLLLDQKDSKYGNFPKSRIVSNSNMVPEDDFSNHENSCKKAYSKFLEQQERVAYTYAQKCTHFYYVEKYYEILRKKILYCKRTESIGQT